MSKPDQLLMITDIKGGNTVENGQAAYLDVEDQHQSLVRLAVKQIDLRKLEIAFADLDFRASQQRQLSHSGMHLEEVSAQGVLDLKANPDVASGGIVLVMTHQNRRSTHILLNPDQIDELARRLDAAKHQLLNQKNPN